MIGKDRVMEMEDEDRDRDRMRILFILEEVKENNLNEQGLELFEVDEEGGLRFVGEKGSSIVERHEEDKVPWAQWEDQTLPQEDP